jgi:hypothetical protein
VHDKWIVRYENASAYSHPTPCTLHGGKMPPEGQDVVSVQIAVPPPTRAMWYFDTTYRERLNAYSGEDDWLVSRIVARESADSMLLLVSTRSSSVRI